jgi:hypothetical protein
MSIQSVLLPVLLQVALVFTLLVQLPVVFYGVVIS